MYVKYTLPFKSVGSVRIKKNFYSARMQVITKTLIML